MEKMQRKLSLMSTGESCVIEAFTDEAMKQKLLEMGCLPGEVITIDRLAPLGCPMAIEISGSMLSLRVDEAEHVLVKPIS
jgi:ferrous iron transport protein A